MLSPRGWWFLALVFGLLLVAVALGVSTLAVVLMTLLAWFLGAWLHFIWVTRHVPKSIEITREIRTPSGPTSVLWARQAATVRLEIRWSGRFALPFVIAIDKFPALAAWPEGESWTSGSLSRRQPLVIEYPLQCPAAGRLRFDGVKFIVTDLQGFFHQTVFVREQKTVRVLPPLVEGPSGVPSRKRHNLLPLVGMHRLFRAGGGSELLDLRDYVPSDPPKLIAWKASARRDRLITKELESEVPVRCTMLLDASSSTRVGPVGRNALARLVEIAAGVLYANAENRDLTGLVIFDEHGVGKRIRPARGRRVFFETLHTLADVADEPPTIEQRDVGQLVPTALGLIQDIYPGWLDRAVNATPLYSLRFWRRNNRWRKKVAAVLANVYGLGPGGVSMLYHEDEACHRYLLRWLNDHRVAVPMFLYDDQGRYLFHAAEKIGVVARALTQSIARAKDNELFVLLVDLLDTEADRGPLVRAVKAARARHHEVHVVFPWPPGVPLPEGREKPPPVLLAPNLQELLNRVTTARFHAAYEDLRREFSRLGVATLAAAEEHSISRILERMHHLRPGARRSR